MRNNLFLTIFFLFLTGSAAAEKPFLFVETGGHMALIRKIIYTKDGSAFVTAGDDKTIRVWDSATGEMIRKISGEIGIGDHGKIYTAALSSDNRLMAVGGFLAPGSDISNVGNIRLFNFHTGELTRLLKGHKNIINCLAFSHNGKMLVSGSFDRNAVIWDISSGNTLHTLEGHGDTVYSAAFSADDKRILTASGDRTMKLWRADTGMLIKTMHGHTDVVKTAIFTPDGRYILSGGYDKKIRLWNGKNGDFIKIMSEQGSNISDLSISPDGTKVVTGHGCCDTKSPNYVFEIPSGKELASFDLHKDIVLATAVSPDGEKVTTAGGNNNEIRTWDIKTGNQLKKIEGKGKKIWTVGFSKDGKHFAWGRKYSKYNIFEWGPPQQSFQIKRDSRGYEITMGDVIDSWSEYRTGIQSVGPWSIRTENGRIDKVLQILKNGRIIHKIERGNLDIYQNYALTMTPDGKRVIAGEGTGRIFSYDTETGKKLNRFVGHTGCIWGVAASPDSRFLVSGSDDQTVRLWDIESGKLLITTFTATDGEWVAWTPEGYYTCSVNGDRYVGWHINRGDDKTALFYPASRFADQFYSPDIVSEYIRTGGDIDKAIMLADKGRGFRKKPKEKISNINTILPPAVFFKIPADMNIKVNDNSVRIKAAAKSLNMEPITDIWLLVNGKRIDKNRGIQIKTGNGKNISGLRAEIDIRIPLTQRNNRISVMASNRFSRSEPEIINVIYEKEETESVKAGSLFKPDLYLLSIGVSDYLEPGLKLDLAHRDARGLAEIFSKQKGRLYKSVNKRLLTNSEATKDAILDGLDWILEAVTQKDLAIIFIAGHGIKDGGGNYYFIPHDGRTDRLRRTAVKWFDFQDVVSRLPSKVILMADTCHSGSITGKRRSSGDMTEALRELVNSDSGVVVMTASTGRELSQERPEWGHGAFTRAIIDGLSGKANYDNNMTIDIKELDLFVTTRVKKLTGGKQHPTTEIPKTLPNFPITYEIQ